MPTPTEELTAISHLLHLSFHRNKNQHRLTKWWSSLSQLRRQVQKLIFELSTLKTAEKFDVTGGKGVKNNPKRSAKGVEGMRNGESKYVKAAREKVELRAEFMERWLFPGCYL
jgi:ribonuclease MRP protein subunit RMP1